VEKRPIGSLSVSVVGVGCNNFQGRIDENRTKEVIDAAIDVGLNFFDTADMYADGKSEELLGRFLGNRRREVIVATKFGNEMEGQGRGARPEYVKKALDASLKRLRMDYVDLYQQHVPDPDVPIAETLGALDALVKAGKVREIGCSNFSATQIREARGSQRRSTRIRALRQRSERVQPAAPRAGGGSAAGRCETTPRLQIGTLRLRTSKRSIHCCVRLCKALRRKRLSGTKRDCNGTEGSQLAPCSRVLPANNSTMEQQ
jgi:hypothetical protein